MGAIQQIHAGSKVMPPEVMAQLSSHLSDPKHRRGEWTVRRDRAQCGAYGFRPG